jgi:hypothetical protein
MMVYLILGSYIFLNLYYSLFYFNIIDQRLSTTRRWYPTLQIFQNSLRVTRKTSTKINIALRPNNCTSDLQPLSVRQIFNNAAYVKKFEIYFNTFLISFFFK